jgi:HlyD family secretion protein
MKKIIIAIVIVVVIGAIVAVNFLKKDKGVEVTTEKIERGFVQQKVTGSGQIKPAVEVKVSAQVAGKIILLNVKEGDRVKRGQLLVALDPQQYEASVERSKSSLLSAQANEKKSLSDFDRGKELFKRTLISQADFDALQANYESASSIRLQNEAALKEAEDALSKTRLYAAMDGTVSRLNKEVGEIAIGATFQEDVIMVVSDLSVMEAVIEVDENDVVNIKLADSAHVEVDAFTDSLFLGRVTEIAHSAVTRGAGTQEQVTNFEVTITLDNPDLRFRPGMSTTVDVLTYRLDNVLKVPIQAVVVREKSKLNKKASVEEPAASDNNEDTPAKEDMQDVVFIQKDNHAYVRPVKIGISDDTHYAVISGLDAGDDVITGPFKILSKTLQNEQLVTIKSKEKGKKDVDSDK